MKKNSLSLLIICLSSQNLKTACAAATLAKKLLTEHTFKQCLHFHTQPIRLKLIFLTKAKGNRICNKIYF